MKKGTYQHFANMAGMNGAIIGNKRKSSPLIEMLKANGNVIPRHTLRPLHVDELHSPQEVKKRETFDALIERRWGTSMTPPPVSSQTENESQQAYYDEDELPRHIPENEDVVDANKKLLCQQPAYDHLINAEVLLHHGDHVQSARVIQRSIGPDGTITGEYDDNPILNSIIYDVEFPDGTIKEYSANVIAENMLTQVDSDRFTMTMMGDIIDHKKDAAMTVSKDDIYITTRRGNKQKRITTCGWKLLVHKHHLASSPMNSSVITDRTNSAPTLSFG